MSMNLSARLDEQVETIVAASGLLLTSTLGDTTYVSLKNYAKCRILISISDGTTVTGSTITLKQATAVAGTGEKALAFTRMLANTDYAASKVMTETAVTSNTFTTQTTNSKDSFYIIDVDTSTLDVAGGFDCIRVDGTGHAATASRGCAVIYELYGARYSGATVTAD
jgi:hypothetical protein